MEVTPAFAPILESRTYVSSLTTRCMENRMILTKKNYIWKFAFSVKPRCSRQEQE